VFKSKIHPAAVPRGITTAAAPPGGNPVTSQTTAVGATSSKAQPSGLTRPAFGHKTHTSAAAGKAARQTCFLSFVFEICCHVFALLTF